MPNKDDAIEVMKQVQDPELQIDVWTLGLIYKIEPKENDGIFIEMTFTSPLCPYAPQLVEEIRQGLLKKGFKEPLFDFSFDPPWQPSDEVKMLLGLS